MECVTALKTPQNHAFEKASGSFIKDQNGGLIATICGGQDNNGHSGDCYSLSETNYSGFMIHPRAGSASLSIDNGRRLWVTGGFEKSWKPNEEGEDVYENRLHFTSEIVHLEPDNQIESCPGPQLPISGLKYHCLEQLGQNVAILNGGQVYNLPLKSRRSWSFNFDTLVWTEMMTMATGRSNHVCAILQDLEDPGLKIVIAAGGYTFREDAVTNSTELLIVKAGKIGSHWQPGPDMPLAIRDAASVTTVNGQTLFVAVGNSGTGNQDQVLPSIYYIQCTNLECQWQVSTEALKRPSSGGLAMMLPPTLTTMSAISGAYQDFCDLTLPYENGKAIYVTGYGWHCPFSGDGHCDEDHNRDECLYDGGDCCLAIVDCMWCILDDDCECHTTGISYCDKQCEIASVEDGICNGNNNLELCGFDGGDCCLGYPQCQCSGDECLCHTTGDNHCGNGIADCPEHLDHRWIFDGVCDDDLNIEACSYDGGDCCPSGSGKENNFDYCSICECID